MPFNPDPPFPKSQGDNIRSKDWNDAVNEVRRLDAAKLDKTGGALSGPLSVAGLVGIGTPTPKYLLSFADVLGDKISLWGSGEAHYGFGIQGALLQIHTDGAGSDVAFGYGASAKLTETMRIKGNGNVGIGTNAPGARLTIQQSGTAAGSAANGKALFVTGAWGGGQNGDGGVEFRHDNLTQGIGFGFNAIYATGTNPNQDITLQSRGTGNVILNPFTGAVVSQGNVGIGTATPYSQLHINKPASGTLGPILTLMSGGSAGSGAAIDFDGYDPGPTNAPSARLQSFDDGAFSSHFLFHTKNPGANANALAERMRIMSNGNVGIGVTDPGFRFDVGDRIRLRQGPSGTAGIWFWQTGTRSDRAFVGMVTDDVVGLWGTGTGWQLMQNCTTGNVGVGTSTPDAKLEVIGTTKTRKLQLGNKWLLSGDGDAESNDDWLRLKNALAPKDYRGGFAAWLLWSNGGVVQGSDIRLKKDVAPLSDATSNLLALRGVRFRWREMEKEKYQLGLIAQEVEEVFPEVVSMGPDGMKGINHAALIAPLIEAFKQQHGEIAELRAELQSLREQSRPRPKTKRGKDA